ncbi:hypothetical protein Q1695_003105 [Nippostrongylus brasiliensis]|nr:hypothetical protein Q1695_003105 [Nippostrongylus brasiliensis]
MEVGYIHAAAFMIVPTTSLCILKCAMRSSDSNRRVEERRWFMSQEEDENGEPKAEDIQAKAEVPKMRTPKSEVIIVKT